MGILEQPRSGRLVVAGLIALGLGAGTFATWWRLSHRPAAEQVAHAVPGEGGRVVVEVLNATSEVGLARTATRRLRDAGLDVVYYGSDAGEPLDTTQVLVRRGDAEAGEKVRRALGAGSVRAAPDPRRLVDVSVRLGRDFRDVAALGRNP